MYHCYSQLFTCIDSFKPPNNLGGVTIIITSILVMEINAQR